MNKVRTAAVLIIIMAMSVVTAAAAGNTAAAAETYTVLSECMPGEYSFGFGKWNFVNANGEGYIAETTLGLGGKAENDGCAMIVGYKGTETMSMLDLYLQADALQGVENAYRPLTLSYAMCVSAGDGCRLSLEAYTGGGMTEVYSAFPNNEKNIMGLTCPESKEIGLELGKWNSYALFADPQTGVCRFSVNGKVCYTGTLNGAVGESAYINKFRFTMKSENDDDCYALDDVSLTCGAERPPCEIVFTADGNSVTATAKRIDNSAVDFSGAMLIVGESLDGHMVNTVSACGTADTRDELSCTLTNIKDTTEITAYLWDAERLAPMCEAYMFTDSK